MPVSIALISSIIVLLFNLGTLFGIFIKVIRWVDRQKEQDVELSKIRHEQSILIVGVLVCLKNLPKDKNDKEIETTIKLFETHLNEQAHN